MQVYLEQHGRPARERLKALVTEAKAGNPLAPMAVVPPIAYTGIGLRRVLGRWRVAPQRRLYGPGTPSRTVGCADHGIAAAAAAVRNG